ARGMGAGSVDGACALLVVRDGGGGAEPCERRDQEREKRRPDPVTRIPAEPATPSPTQPCNRAPWLGREPQSALEAVLLIGLVGRSAPRALRRLERIGALLLGGRGRDAHCYSSQLSGFAPLFSSSGAAALPPSPFPPFS